MLSFHIPGSWPSDEENPKAGGSLPSTLPGQAHPQAVYNVTARSPHPSSMDSSSLPLFAYPTLPDTEPNNTGVESRLANSTKPTPHARPLPQKPRLQFSGGNTTVPISFTFRCSPDQSSSRRRFSQPSPTPVEKDDWEDGRWNRYDGLLCANTNAAPQMPRRRAVSDTLSDTLYRINIGPNRERGPNNVDGETGPKEPSYTALSQAKQVAHDASSELAALRSLDLRWTHWTGLKDDAERLHESECADTKRSGRDQDKHPQDFREATAAGARFTADGGSTAKSQGDAYAGVERYLFTQRATWPMDGSTHEKRAAGRNRQRGAVCTNLSFVRVSAASLWRGMWGPSVTFLSLLLLLRVCSCALQCRSLY